MIPGIVAQAVPGSSVGPAERWWRVRFPVLNTGNGAGTGSNHYCDIRFVSMATTAGGANLVPSYLDYQQSVIGGNLLNAVVDNSSLWNNSGIHVLGADMWGAFKLPTGDPIVEVKIRNHNGVANYSPFVVLVESSWDGINWEFEWGRARTTWSVAELKTFTKPAIDFSSYTRRDWLLQAFKTTGFNNMGIYEMEMADSIGGSDLCTGGTPRSEGNTIYPASNLTDNNLSSLCGSTGEGNRAYVGYSFATAQKIEEVRGLSWVNGEQLDWGALCVGIGGTDGSFSHPEWWIKQIVSGMTNVGGGVATNMDFRNPRNPAGASGAHRYWRVRATSGNLRNDSTYAVAALDFKDGGSSLVGSGTPMGSTQSGSGGQIAYAFDGNTATLWASASTRPFQWIGYDFGSAVLPDEIVLQARNDATYWNQMFRYFSVDWSDDGKMWYPKEAFLVSTIAGALQMQTFALT